MRAAQLLHRKRNASDSGGHDIGGDGAYRSGSSAGERPGRAAVRSDHAGDRTARTRSTRRQGHVYSPGEVGALSAGEERSSALIGDWRGAVTVVGFCDEAYRDLDVSVVNQHGMVVAAEYAVDPRPVVTFAALPGYSYTLKVRMSGKFVPRRPLKLARVEGEFEGRRCSGVGLMQPTADEESVAI